ncbi:TetR family transcriptional regulator [Mycobacteroides franklinii]|uniref:Putative DNA-binding transcriptional regulator n=1 Tax=Mycobacteroides franklinii TaxID=948102 RepID=A0A1S1LEZ0_9MYCO|nr:TetR family transcriptional regulator [Mycobacteroides franklinii]ORA59559.1 TetR family transcriptional regulator [Mycobacteroides franklinii]TDZ46267.1 putative DNA-binding transcriptional regulator [Mycobacteroides franklinii]TDZ47776.1 putative DNA-binding transcriptional regulator [Mycobacteroides franklinii]TDZ59984.1 putative DNA-binding transcriptional regulator [Mycobacteroides franklinii]
MFSDGNATHRPQATPKGERRRRALISAAADLLRDNGIDAVRHRAVAQRAGLPLASTTYYFSSLEDLIARAVEHAGTHELEQIQERLSLVQYRRRGAAATAEAVVDLLFGTPGFGAGEQLVSRYERELACSRHPELREVQQRLREQRDDAVAQVVRRSGRSIDNDRVAVLISTVDGAMVGALTEAAISPTATATSMLVDVIDVLAPLEAEQLAESVSADEALGRRAWI